MGWCKPWGKVRHIHVLVSLQTDCNEHVNVGTHTENVKHAWLTLKSSKLNALLFNLPHNNREDGIIIY